MRQLSTISHDGPQQQGKFTLDRSDEQNFETNDLENINCKCEGLNDILKSTYGYNKTNRTDDPSNNSSKYLSESVHDETNSHTKSINEKSQEKKVDSIGRNDKDNSKMVLNSTSNQTNSSSCASSPTSANNTNNEDKQGVKI
jgi:hypothetical protein